MGSEVNMRGVLQVEGGRGGDPPTDGSGTHTKAKWWIGDHHPGQERCLLGCHEHLFLKPT